MCVDIYIYIYIYIYTHTHTHIMLNNTVTNIIQSLAYLDANELKRNTCCIQNMEI